MSSLLTITTDFGARDPYVAAMKGVILGIAPRTRLVDLTHEIPPQDIMEAAYFLKHSVPHFPPGSIHLVVVDPGVGTDRLAVALEHGGHLFVGPDNGIFSLLLEGATPASLVALDEPSYWRAGHTSKTFHGRDIFAPAAAHLAAGVPIDRLGSPRDQLKQLRWALPIVDDRGVRGWVVHVDHFGNCITNIPQEMVDQHARSRSIKGYAGTTVFEGLRATYADVDKNEPVALFGSSGCLEIAINGGNASELLGIRRGDPVDLMFLDRRTS